MSTVGSGTDAGYAMKNAMIAANSRMPVAASAVLEKSQLKRYIRNMILDSSFSLSSSSQA